MQDDGPLIRSYLLGHMSQTLWCQRTKVVSGGNSSPVSNASKKDALCEIVEVSKALQQIITTSTIRKRNADRLIKLLTKEKEAKEEEANNEEEEQSSSDSEEKQQLIC